MKIVALFLSVSLVGCASTGDYAAYANGQAAIESAKHSADAARYKAMSDIASGGDATAKVAAVMALALGQNTQSVVRIQAPKSDADIALSWAQILVPGIVNVAGIAYGAKVATTASNNAANVSMNTNNAFVGIAGKIQASPIVVPQANVSTTNTVTNTDRHDSISTVDSHDSTSTVLSGTGTLGSGAYGFSESNNTSTTTSAPVVFTPVVITNPVVAP